MKTLSLPRMENTITDLLALEPDAFESVLTYISGHLEKAGFSLELHSDTYAVWRRGENWRTAPMLCVHSDTVWDRRAVFNIQRGYIYSADPSMGIGGDDRAGIAALIHAVSQCDAACTVALFDQEESGCVGSSDLGEDLTFDPSLFIGLDRRGSCDVADYGYASSELLLGVQALLGYKVVQGTWTDVAVLARLRESSCINLATGFYREHTPDEYIVMEDVLRAAQDLAYMLECGL